MYAEAFGEKVKRENDNEITAAYLTALWQRVKKMPDLKKLLEQEDKPKKRAKQTPEQMYQNLIASVGGVKKKGG